MHFNAAAAITNLHCTTPTDPSGHDEPYMWLFFVKLDGSTVRQRFDSGHHPLNSLSATVSVQCGPGGHSNLASDKAVSTSNIRVPAAVGSHETPLKPIDIALEGATQTIHVFVPGSLFVLALVMDEDSAPDVAPVAALAAVREHIEHRINDIINAMDLSGPILGAIGAMSQGLDPAPVALAGVIAQITQLQQTITQEAVDLAIERAKDAALADADWWNPLDGAKLVVAALDPDEVVGSATFLLTEQSLIGGSLAQTLRADVRQSATGLGGAWYVLNGAASASVKFFPGDMETFLLGAPKRKNLQRAPHVVRTGRRCVKAGTKVWVTRVGYTETHVASANYPFLTYRYFLDDVELVGDQDYSNEPGSVELPNKTVGFPEFDESKFYLVGERQEVRNVKLKFERRTDPLRPQIVQLLISNDPKDGCYSTTLRIEAVLPDGRNILVGTEDIAITGQVLETPDGFLERYIQCVASYLKSLQVRIKPTVPAQWQTPEIKWQRLEVARKRLDELGKARVFDTATVNRAKLAVARKLGLG